MEYWSMLSQKCLIMREKSLENEQAPYFHVSIINLTFVLFSVLIFILKLIYF